jgi:GTPase SAR1 family protein
VRVLVGNKTDLADARAVSQAEAQDFAAQHQLSFFETSALSGDRLDDAFLETAHEIYAKVQEGRIELNNPLSGARAPLSAAPQMLAPQGQGARGPCC